MNCSFKLYIKVFNYTVFKLENINNTFTFGAFEALFYNYFPQYAKIQNKGL